MSEDECESFEMGMNYQKKRAIEAIKDRIKQNKGIWGAQERAGAFAAINAIKEICK